MNEVSNFTNSDLTKPLEWLLESLGIILASQSKLATVRHLEKHEM